MMEVMWAAFCRNWGSTNQVAMNFSSICVDGVHPLVISLDILLFLILSFILFRGSCFEKKQISQDYQRFLPLGISSAIFNGGLGLVYLVLGCWVLGNKLVKEKTALPLNAWVVLLFHGFTWLLLILTVSLRRQPPPHSTMKLCSMLAFLISGILCGASLWKVIVDKAASPETVVDIFSFPGAILLVSFVFRGQRHYIELNDGLYATLLGEEASATAEMEAKEDDSVTPFARAGLLSKMTFGWLNQLMKKGNEKILEDKDIPLLRLDDQAKTCYSLFLRQSNELKQKSSSEPPSIFRTIVHCYWKPILLSGFFALVKVVTISLGPLFLKAFIEVAEGKEVFKHEVYALAGGLFLLKCIESAAGRHWFFISRLIGLRVRSSLCAAIYQKQLRLSNATNTRHSAGDVVNYLTVDAYRIAEFPYWFHKTWSTSLQIFIALIIIYYSVGLATMAAVLVMILTVIGNFPLAKAQHKYQSMFMAAQKERLKATSEVFVSMKVLKLHAWETQFKNVLEKLREEEYKWLSALQQQKGYYIVLFWTAPILVSIVTLVACYYLGISITASRVFTLFATLRIAQEPIRLVPDVIQVFIEAMVSLDRIVKFLEAPEIQSGHIRQTMIRKEIVHSIFISSADLSWDADCLRPTLKNINLEVKPSEKVAICGEVGSGKSTLVAAILGELPCIKGMVHVCGKIAYVAQTAWIQTGTVQENILFGSTMDHRRYNEVLEKCALVKDLEMFPFGDSTQIGERGVNLSGGQKQRLQLARALYQDADIYILDDPFSALDAQTATSLFKEYVMEALSRKTVLLVTHQVDFLPAFDRVLLLSEGEILQATTYDHLLATCKEFQDLVNAHNDTIDSKKCAEYASSKTSNTYNEEIKKIYTGGEQSNASPEDQFIKKEEREMGDAGLKPYIQYLNQRKGLLYFFLTYSAHFMFLVGQILQSLWMAKHIQDKSMSQSKLVIVYSVIGLGVSFFLLVRSYLAVLLGLEASKYFFSTLMTSLFRAPMSFYDSTPLGRLLSRVSSDFSIIDLDLPLQLTAAVGTTMTSCSNFVVLAALTWQALFVIIPMLYLVMLLQKYYFASAKELNRINGTTTSLVTSHLAESIAGVVTIRAFGQEERFFAKNLDLIDTNASPFFHSFTATEWLIGRLEVLCAIVLSTSALLITLLGHGYSSSGFIGMALSFGLSVNEFVVYSVTNQCVMANLIVSVERLSQYMQIPSEAPEVLEENRPQPNWPSIGKVEICDLKIRYRTNAPFVLQGISCIIEGGHRIGIVGRTGSGKTTLISALFRLVEPTNGKIIIDGLNISTIGLHDLRSKFGVIPQDPNLFSGSVRHNVDPLSQHTDQEIWEVLKKCQLIEAIQEKEAGLDSLVVQDGTNWSLGQRQLFCLGRALLRRSRILVLDEATASIDNATDAILQKTIRAEFAGCTVITVAHRIPTVMDSTKVLAISDGKLVEYDEPMKLIQKEGSLFGQLVKEYYSHIAEDSSPWADLP
ncbi:ABC transporter C family member 10-like [Malania oleifera]|uniref:ABC transporter C family member 10-like n=1 Tax=Malania oleifera TaxID=397392 RepID=UPI0025AEC9BB|nr:ABC transporter C family member 10-like [Malania oleifera]